MAKKQLNELEVCEEFDFDEMSYPDDSMADVMSKVIEASNHQMTMAFELTKLIVSSNPSEKNTAEHIFSTFKKATQVVGESFTLKPVMDQIEQ